MSYSSRGRNGVLPINPTIMKKAAAKASDPKASPKPLSPRLRLIVRRLPPGMTEVEFWACIGDEWKSGAGKVDWTAYKDGKISKDPSKPSRPARAYLRVKESSYLDLLSTKVKQTTFHDAKNTTKDSCLIGPPSLEFAPLNKVPGGRVRHDGRQGTIDQDQEFIDFLQSLTEPITKASANGAEAGEGKGAITITPLVQYIKEKKAAKAKDAAAAKSAKAEKAKASKTEQKAAAVVVKNAASTSTEKARMAKATQDTVKAINRSVAAMQSKGAAPNPEAKTTPTKDGAAASNPVKRERERGNASIAARILQRDLGLTPKESRRASRGLQNPGPPAEEDKTPKVNLPPSAPSPTQPQTQASPTTPTGPRSTRGPAPSSKPTPAPQRPPKPLPQPSAGAKSAFLKHANPSQGVTEDLLRAAFEAFGILTRCEIDRKKGFGYVDFTDTDGLKKAMQASPVKVGNGQVVVLENKSRPQSKAGPLSVPASPALTTAQPEVVTQASTSVDDSATESAVTPVANDAASSSDPTTAAQPPTAPKAQPAPAARGGANANTRASRAHAFGPGRGNFAPGNRGGPRGGFRGGRGSMPFHPRGGRGAAAAAAAATPAASGAGNGAPPASDGA